MAADVTVRITADDSALAPVLAEATLLIRRWSASGRELPNRLLDLLDEPSQLVCVESVRLPAPRADEVRISFQPSEALLHLVAALDRGLEGIEHG